MEGGNVQVGISAGILREGILRIVRFARFQRLQVNPLQLFAFLGHGCHLNLRTRVGRLTGDGHLAVFRIVVDGSFDAVARNGQPAGQFRLEPLLVLGIDQADDLGQQEARDVLDIIHGAGLLLFAVTVSAVAFAVPVSVFSGSVAARVVAGSRGGCGGGLRGRLGGGMDDDVARRVDRGILVYPRVDVLHQHVDREIAAGLGNVRFTLACGRLDVHVPFRGQAHVAVLRRQRRAVHDGMHVGHHRGNRQREGQVAGAGPGLDLHGTFRGGVDAARGGQFGGIVDIDFGIQHHHADSQGGQIAVAAARLDLRHDVGLHGDGAAVVGNTGFGAGGPGGFAEVHACVHFAADVDLRAADLDVDHVQHVGDCGDVQNAAVLVDDGGDVHVLHRVDRRGAFDIHDRLVGDVEEVGGHRFGGGDHVVQGDALALVAFAFCFLLERFAGEGGDGHVLADDLALQGDILALNRHVQVRRDQVAQFDHAAGSHFIGVNDQVVQQLVVDQNRDAPVVLRGRFDNEVREDMIAGRIVIYDNVIRSLNFVVFQLNFDPAFVGQFVCH